jgi:hypothetical protein
MGAGSASTVTQVGAMKQFAHGSLKLLTLVRVNSGWQNSWPLQRKYFFVRLPTYCVFVQDSNLLEGDDWERHLLGKDTEYQR